MKILSYKNERGDKTLGHKFNRQEIEKLLQTGGLTNKWLDTESKRINLKLSKKVLKEYPYTRFIAWVSLVIALGLGILELIRFLKGL